MLMNSEPGGLILFMFTWKGHDDDLIKTIKNKTGERDGEVASVAKGPS